MTIGSRILKTHPATLVLASFVSVIALGTLLLKLPVSLHTGHITWVDALFTATSAVCVTGLIVVDTGTFFTHFGQYVILLLIQIGGLGLMTISVALFQMLGRSVSFRQRMIMQDLFAHTPREDIFSLVKSILLFTLFAEALGAGALAVRFSNDMPFGRAVFTAVFHSVSAFCNAGFSLFPDSLVRYSGDSLLNITVCSLIVIGGIGFPVLYDCREWFRSNKKSRRRLSIQTRTVMTTTLVLIIGGAVLFAFLERDVAMASPSAANRFWTPIFQSITCRTAGFNTVDIAALEDATIAMMIFLMFFGASPGSCGGGVKTTTLALLAAFTMSRVRRKRRVNMFRKSIPIETVNRSVSLILVSTGIIGLVLFMILMGDPVTRVREPFLAFFFETVSAFGTVGLSMGVTSELETWGKTWIILMMIIGRVGVLTFSYIIVGTGAANGVEYAEENLMIG